MIEPTPETAPYWAGLAEGRLLLRRCAACGRMPAVPRAICRCGSADGVWAEAPAGASLASFTEVARRPHGLAHLPEPYTLALVALPGVAGHLMALLLEAPAPRIGMRLDFRPYRAGDTVLPAFVPAGGATHAEVI